LEAATTKTTTNLRAAESYGLEVIGLAHLIIMNCLEISLFWDVTQRRLVVAVVSGYLSVQSSRVKLDS
jgi:hypothetical protein